MTRKKNTPPPPPIPKRFSSSNEIDNAIKLLQRRIDELQKLKDDNVDFQDHRVDTAEGNVQQAIQKVFGSESPEYQEHQYFSLPCPQAIFLLGNSMLPSNGDAQAQARFLENIDKSIGMLQGLIARINEQRDDLISEEIPSDTTKPKGEKIFIVHGRDSQVRLEVQHFITKITSTPVIILHEQPNQGKTIIEKFEHHAQEAGLAVVLLTGDDVGSLKGEEHNKLRPRARQNVILELGYFMGALRRHRIIALFEEGIEKPSDYDGVLYVSLSGDWKIKLAQELRSCGLSVDMNKAI
jgi:predicted nucleotide-binding protein